MAVNIDWCTAAQAKIWVIYRGLQMAWNSGFRKIVLEVDSQLVFQWLRTRHSSSGPSSNLVNLYCQLLDRN